MESNQQKQLVLRAAIEAPIVASYEGLLHIRTKVEKHRLDQNMNQSEFSTAQTMALYAVYAEACLGWMLKRHQICGLRSLGFAALPFGIDKKTADEAIRFCDYEPIIPAVFKEADLCCQIVTTAMVINSKFAREDVSK